MPQHDVMDLVKQGYIQICCGYKQLLLNLIYMVMIIIHHLPPIAHHTPFSSVSVEIQLKNTSPQRNLSFFCLCTNASAVLISLTHY